MYVAVGPRLRNKDEAVAEKAADDLERGPYMIRVLFETPELASVWIVQFNTIQNVDCIDFERDDSVHVDAVGTHDNRRAHIHLQSRLPANRAREFLVGAELDQGLDAHFHVRHRDTLLTEKAHVVVLELVR